MRIAIIDYESGNLHSVAKAFEQAAGRVRPGSRVEVTSRAEDLADATHIVLPGVGAFGDCRAGLFALDGMVEALHEAVRTEGKPFLGICVGMQMLADVGHEHGSHPGLGWIAGEVTALKPQDDSLKIPHMGWNDLQFDADAHPFFDGIAPGRHAYFVHSYGFVAKTPETVIARVEYGGMVSAVVAQENMIGTQFHPEKSQATGLQLLTNFLRWRP